MLGVSSGSIRSRIESYLFKSNTFMRNSYALDDKKYDLQNETNLTHFFSNSRRFFQSEADTIVV